MKMTLKEFKDLVGKDKEMNEGFMDFFRKKSSEKDQPKEYPVEKYKKLYSKLQGLQRAVQLNSNEKKLIDLIGDKLERYDEAQKGNLEPDSKKRMMQTQLVEIKTSYLPDLFKSLSKNHPEDFKHYFGSGDVDSNLNEGFMDFFRKKDKSVEAPEVEPVEDVKKYMRLYRELFTFAKDVNVGKKDLAFLEQIKRELNRIKFSPINKKSSITSNAVQKIRTQYLPMLLQSLMNNHNKEFNRYVDKDFINSFEIEVPTVRYSSSDVSPKELYFVADEMLKFAVKQDYKDVYIRKLNSLLQKAKEFKNLYEKSPDDFGAYYQEFNSLVIELKKMLTTWRNKFNVNYNMLPTGVKYFALNEQSFKKNIKEEGETRKPTMADFAKFIGYEGQEEKIRMVKTIVDMSDSDGAYTTFEDEGDEDATGIIEAIWFDYGSWGEAIKAFNKEFRDSQNMG